MKRITTDETENQTENSIETEPRNPEETAIGTLENNGQVDGNSGGSGRMEKRKLTAKMLRILTLIAEHGYLSLAEIGGIYGNPDWARGALHNLTLHGLATPISTYSRLPKVYLLTRQGFDFLNSLGNCRVLDYVQECDFKLTTMGHHLDLVRSRLILEKHPKVKDFAPERVLAFKRIPGGRLSDARFLFGDTRVALEVELTLKRPETMRQILLALDQDAWIERVLWVVSSGTIMERIQRLAAGMGTILRHPSRHWFLLREEFFKQRLSAPWYDLGGRVQHVTQLESEDRKI